MIITRLIGGLGNQMFQYAVGRALSTSRQVPVYLDISSYTYYNMHQGFELQHVFECDFFIASYNELNSVLGWRAVPIVKNLLPRLNFFPFSTKAIIIEPHFYYWSGIQNAPSNAYLYRYWQSEKYFRSISTIIRSDFTFRQSMSILNETWANKILSCMSVSIHVRRGDYASNARTFATHGLCSLNYYDAAVRFIADRVDKPEFFIFSDDIGWAQKNLKLGYPCHYIDHNSGAESYNDMRLMSLCRHHIIANSTFSWWAAWLNPRPEKIVIAPSQWFAPEVNRALGGTIDLIPDSWITL